MENFVAPKIFLKFCLLANGSREGQVGKTLSPQLASVSIRGPFLTELFQVVFEQKDPDATMKCLTTLI